jgi:formylglycine-generating enzyme required for sulfatase activity
MGSPSSEEGRDDDETQHLVTLTQGYWLGRTEVTQKQWASLMGSSIRSLRSKAGGTRGMVGEGDDYPVYYVSWDDAMQFCRKLTERERSAGRLPDGYVFTLPTEAQWDYACRAGSDGPFANDLNSNEWYIANSGNRSHPVGERGGNPWGFADMHGNVREWSLDWYGDYPQGGVSDPAGAPGGTYRVFRGGGWFSHPGRCRSAERNRSSADFRINTLGFRVCLAPEPELQLTPLLKRPAPLRQALQPGG